MSTPEVYMNSAREDEEMERDIREFMEVILDEEDEREYTDYRQIFCIRYGDCKPPGRQRDCIRPFQKTGFSQQRGEADTVLYYPGGKPSAVLSANGLLCKAGLYR